jgi:hypothetical protein
MANRYESLIDQQIREAQERGEFDNLPGAGKPLPAEISRHDRDWWIKGLVKREGISGRDLLPPSIALRREVEDLPTTLREAARTEAQARALIDDLNQRIVDARHRPVNGPPVLIRRIDADAALARWRADRG